MFDASEKTRTTSMLSDEIREISGSRYLTTHGWVETQFGIVAVTADDYNRTILLRFIADGRTYRRVMDGFYSHQYLTTLSYRFAEDVVAGRVTRRRA